MLERINPAVELRISATPKTLHPDEKVKVYRQDVIAAEMIKKEVVLNPDIELDFSEERTLNENLIKAALAKRNQLAELYQELGVKINPLLLIQLPNDVKETNDFGRSSYHRTGENLFGSYMRDNRRKWIIGRMARQRKRESRRTGTSR